MKAHGVTGRKPLHALRKEYGSLINEKYDLVTAKELLRHSSVAITAAHYVENRKRGTTGLGAVLVKRQRKGEGKKISELGSNNGRIGHVINRAKAGRKGEKVKKLLTIILTFAITATIAQARIGWTKRGMRRQIWAPYKNLSHRGRFRL